MVKIPGNSHTVWRPLCFRHKEEGLNFDEILDPSVLSYFGLVPGASVDDIKKAFRELAKKHHPDCGGSSENILDMRQRDKFNARIEMKCKGISTSG